MTLDELFALVDAIEPDATGCKIWPRSSGTYYPNAQIGKSGNIQAIHRCMLERKLGRPIGEGLCSCHTCDVKACVAEEHLWEGSTQDNIADKVAKGRQPQGDSHGMRLHPEARACGDRHGMRLHPERVPRGERSGMFGKIGAKHHNFGKKFPNASVAMTQVHLQRRTIYWGA